MNVVLYLIPIALVLGLLGLGAFLWAVRSGQYEDLDGAAQRILFDDDDEDASGPDGPDTDARESKPGRTPTNGPS
jgi:cbb3-type cytochrome oxidase maturation protein